MQKLGLVDRAPGTTTASGGPNQVQGTCSSPGTRLLERGDPDPFPSGDPRSSHSLLGTPQSVHHAWPSHAVPPPSVAAVDPVHIHSDCPSNQAASDHCSAGACIPSPGRSEGYPPHDIPPPAFASPGCFWRTATLLWPPPRQPDLSKLLRPSARTRPL